MLSMFAHMLMMPELLSSLPCLLIVKHKVSFFGTSNGKRVSALKVGFRHWGIQ